MRLRLLMRRLTVSAPHMAVRSAMPWPLRWALAALVAGFCGALALWAFEQGKTFAGLGGAPSAELGAVQHEVRRLQLELDRRTAERDRAEVIAHTAQTRQAADDAAHQQLLAQTKSLLAENQQLREDLAFFEQILPSTDAKAGQVLTVRALQGVWSAPGLLQWRVLMMQSGRVADPIQATLELTAVGQMGDKSWTGALPGSPVAVSVGRYARLEGTYAAPKGVRIKSLHARLLRDGQVQTTATALVAPPAAAGSVP